MFLWRKSTFEMKCYWTCLFFTLFSNVGYSQSLFHTNSFEVNINSGYLLKNYPEFPERLNNPYIITFHIGKQLNGAQFWHRYYRYPFFSIQAGYCNLGNDKVLGDFYFMLPELAFSQKAGSKFHVEERLGLGLAYFTRPFHPETNRTNILTGSHVTFMPSASLGFGYNITNSVSVFARINIHHGSNSHFKLPNLGANVPSAGIGIRYSPACPEIVNQQDAFVRDKRFHLNLRAALGINQRGGTTDYVGEKHFGIYLLQLYLSRNYHEITRYHIGLEASYNSGTYDTIHAAGFYSKNQRLKASSFVFMLGHEFLLGHFSLCAQGGIFLYNPYHRDMQKIKGETNVITKMESLFLARIGFNYYFKNAILFSSQQLFAGIFIKTNFGRADFLESSIGFMF